jgi:hypothetical protein
MQKESKLLAWLSVLLLNVIVLFLILIDGSQNVTRLIEDPVSFFIDWGYLFVISSLVTVIPTLLSYAKGTWKKYTAYGIAAISLLTVIGGFIQMNTCTGKMCGLLGIILMIGAGIVLIFFSLSFAVAEYAAPKKNIWMYLVLALEAAAIAWLASNIGQLLFL